MCKLKYSSSLEVSCSLVKGVVIGHGLVLSISISLSLVNVLEKNLVIISTCLLSFVGFGMIGLDVKVASFTIPRIFKIFKFILNTTTTNQ